MIGIEINANQLTALRKACGEAKKSFAKELAAGINATTKATRTQISKDIRSVVAMKKKDVDAKLKITSKATAQNPVGHVVLEAGRREGLQYYDARQDKRGVSYKIKPGGGRSRVNGAFMGPTPGVLAPKLNGGVFKRAGSTRLPIVKLYGVSAIGAWLKNDFTADTIGFISKGLEKQMERRIKLNVLRANGLVSK
tara:strand:+ start:155 stop:739 length:585 start_codon:yes stop_codon:yes gene_type:complete